MKGPSRFGQLVRNGEAIIFEVAGMQSRYRMSVVFVDFELQI